MKTLRTLVPAVLAVVAAAIITVLGVPASAQATSRITIVHQERVMVGPHSLTLGFSKWPLAEGVSFDLLIDPEGGITDKSGTLSVLSPAGRPAEFWDKSALPRHPSQRTSWGLDVVSFQDTGAGGNWALELDVRGPEGTGRATVAVPFEPLPGPSPTLSWLIAGIPMLLIALMVLTAWIRVRPGRRPDAWSLGTSSRSTSSPSAASLSTT